MLFASNGKGSGREQLDGSTSDSKNLQSLFKPNVVEATTLCANSSKMATYTSLVDTILAKRQVSEGWVFSDFMLISLIPALLFFVSHLEPHRPILSLPSLLLETRRRQNPELCHLCSLTTCQHFAVVCIHLLSPPSDVFNSVRFHRHLYYTSFLYPHFIFDCCYFIINPKKPFPHPVSSLPPNPFPPSKVLIVTFIK